MISLHLLFSTERFPFMMQNEILGHFPDWSVTCLENKIDEIVVVGAHVKRKSSVRYSTMHKRIDGY